MTAFASALVLFTTLVATITHIAANPGSAIHELVARQTFSPPPGCGDQCASLLSAASTPSCSTSIECLCGNDVVSKVQQCAQCDAAVVGSAAAESLYDDYANACKQAGITVPSFTPSSSGGSSGNAGSTNNNKGSGGAYSNLQLSAAGIIGSAALAFMTIA